MTWYVMSAFLFFVAIFILVISFIRDSKYLKSRTKDVLSDELREEIEEEREINKKKMELFKKALEEAKKH